VAAKVTPETAAQLEALARVDGCTLSTAAAAAIVLGLRALAQTGRLREVTSPRSARRAGNDSQEAPDARVSPGGADAPGCELHRRDPQQFCTLCSAVRAGILDGR
jgi:hypothetical protein